MAADPLQMEVERDLERTSYRLKTYPLKRTNLWFWLIAAALLVGAMVGHPMSCALIAGLFAVLTALMQLLGARAELVHTPHELIVDWRPFPGLPRRRVALALRDLEWRFERDEDRPTRPIYRLAFRQVPGGWHHLHGLRCTAEEIAALDGALTEAKHRSKLLALDKARVPEEFKHLV